MEKTYELKNVCATAVSLEIKDSIIKNIVFYGGCPGNLKAIAALLKDMPIKDIIQKLDNITCGNKNTSCSNELVKILKTL